MTDRDAFLSSIFADPDDDTPRLVYADWLDDHGEAERAEFIRVQCELAAMGNGCPADDPLYCAKFNRWHALRRRELELLADPTTRLKDEIPGGPWSIVSFESHLRSAGFRRGFVHKLTGPWDIVRDRLDSILRVQPVRKVRLTEQPGLSRLKEFLGAERMRKVLREKTTVSLTSDEIGRERCKQFLEDRWRVEFELPPVNSFTLAPGETATLPGGQRITAPPDTRLEGRFLPGHGEHSLSVEWAEFDTDHPTAAP